MICTKKNTDIKYLFTWAEMQTEFGVLFLLQTLKNTSKNYTSQLPKFIMNFYKSVIEHDSRLNYLFVETTSIPFHGGKDYKEKLLNMTLTCKDYKEKIDFCPTLYALTQQETEYKNLQGQYLKPITFKNIDASARKFRREVVTQNSPIYALKDTIINILLKSFLIT